MGTLQTKSFIKQKISKIRLICLFVPACCLSLLCFSSAWGKPQPPSESNWFVDMNRFSNSAHTSIKCEECHGTMLEKGKAHPDPKDPDYLKKDPKRTFDYRQCEKCHKKSYERFTKGAHAEALEKEKKTGEVSKTGYAPTCGDCHSAHYAPAHLSRVETGKNMTETCGSCHPDQKTSFLANFHGKAAVNLGYDKSAFCTDCHGAHESLSLKDKKEALNACRRCHLDAKEGFADIIIHDSNKDIEKKSDAKKQGLRIVHLLGWISFVFVVMVLAFFYSHSSLLLLRKIHEKLRSHK